MKSRSAVVRILPSLFLISQKLDEYEAFSPSIFASARRHRTSALHDATRVNGDFIPSGRTSAPPCGGYSDSDSFNLIVLGDLHTEDDMTCHEQARDDCIAALEELSLLPCPTKDGTLQKTPNAGEKVTVESIIRELEESRAGDLSAAQLEMLLARKKDGKLMKCHLISLGDLGRKDIRHEPGDAGTTKSFIDAKAYLDGFGFPLELVTGNHDLEGMDEFDTDEANLKAWMDCFGKDKPQFCKQVGDRTLLLGLSTTRFRNAPFSSHEVHVDDEQLKWFVDTVKAHPAEDGWKICVFTHAPVMGSGLRVLQNVHVMNGCAWLNHCSPNSRNLFIRTVKENPQIKLWFSGHFHLSHDYQDAISTVGSCTFVQAGVVGPTSTRDGRRQTRLVQGASDRLKIYTINHHKRNEKTGKAELRLDAEIDIATGEVSLAHGNQDYDHDNWFSAYVPEEEDGCYLETPEGRVACTETVGSKVCWWHMSDGAVLGLHEGQLVEYDAETLSPLGIVVTKKQLDGREVLVVEEGTAVVLLNEETGDVEVVHPNDDGSYWRKFQRNKRVRQEEKAREAVAKLWLSKQKQVM